MTKCFKFPHGNSHRKFLNSLDSFLSSEDEVFGEFARLQEYSAVHCTGDTQTASSERNKDKNRYRDVLPYCWRTVRIPDEEARPGEEQNKYINASWIVFKNMKQSFIASQGPMEDTISDFWVCVMSHNVRTICQLTPLVEGGRVKCAQYWPDGPSPLLCDQVQVRLASTEEQDSLVIRTFSLLNTARPEQAEKVVTHISVREWADYSVPDSTSVLLNLIQLIENLNKPSSSSSFDRIKAGSDPPPVLVHCSAGVGRTGTLIAAYRIIQEMRSSSFLSQVPSPWDTVVSMRAARPMMVQQGEQYLFIFQTIRDFLKLKQ